MDRQTTYIGAVPSAKDVANLGQFTMTALAKLSAGVLGTNTAVNGFTCIPTTPASLAVSLTAGEIYQIENLEQSASSTLAADSTHTILKQGIMLDAVTIGITPPSTSGYSQCFLIEVQYNDLDTATTVLNYFNSSNPLLPFYGPPVGGTGSGAAQSTVRKGAVAYQVKAGTAATTGTQTVPSADAGWTGLFLITVANGASTITSGNIVTLTSAPFIPVTLPAIPAAFQANTWISAVAGGSANALTASISPAPAALTGLKIRLTATYTNTTTATFNLNQLGALTIVDGTGSAVSPGAIHAGAILNLDYTGSAWQLTGPAAVNPLGPYYGVDTGSANAMSVTGLGTPATGTFYIIKKSAAANTGATTLSIGGVTANLVFSDSVALVGLEWPGNAYGMVDYDGSNYRLLTRPKSPIVGQPLVYDISNASGTYTPSVNCTLVEAYGWGNGGPGATTSSLGGWAGGGSGAYCWGIYAVTPGVGVSYVVPGVVAAGSNGAATTFGAFFTAGGGGKATNNTPGTGGTGTGGQINISGVAGGTGFLTNGNDVFVGVGAPAFQSSQTSAIFGGATAAQGSYPGGGGASGNSGSGNHTGGNGAAGRLVIREIG